MCGIAGVRNFGKSEITREEISLLLVAIEHRGLHATGIALENPDGIHIYKAPIPAWQFTRSDEFEEFLDEHLSEATRTALLHTRWATVGNPEDNNNNHPISDGETVITHNGGINNHDWLFDQGKYKKSCETDSDIVRAIVSEHGMDEKGIRELSKMSGSAAIACLSTKYPDKLLLARSGSPLVFGFTESGDKLYWASEAQAIVKASRPWQEVRGVWVQAAKSSVSIGSMPDNTAWVFNKSEKERHQEFRVCVQYRKPDYSRGRENYHAKKKGWKRELRRQIAANAIKEEPIKGFAMAARSTGASTPSIGSVLKCPGCGAPNKNYEGKAWEQLACSNCECGLGE